MFAPSVQPLRQSQVPNQSTTRPTSLQAAIKLRSPSAVLSPIRTFVLLNTAASTLRIPSISRSAQAAPVRQATAALSRRSTPTICWSAPTLFHRNDRTRCPASLRGRSRNPTARYSRIESSARSAATTPRRLSSGAWIMQLAAFSATTAGGTGDTTPPTVPSNFITSVLSSSQIALTWTAATDNVGVTAYQIERYRSEAEAEAYLARPSSTGTTSGSPTARPARCRDSTGRRPRSSSRPSAAR